MSYGAPTAAAAPRTPWRLMSPAAEGVVDRPALTGRLVHGGRRVRVTGIHRPTGTGVRCPCRVGSSLVSGPSAPAVVVDLDHDRQAIHAAAENSGQYRRHRRVHRAVHAHPHPRCPVEHPSSQAFPAPPSRIDDHDGTAVVRDQHDVVPTCTSPRSTSASAWSRTCRPLASPARRRRRGEQPGAGGAHHVSWSPVPPVVGVARCCIPPGRGGRAASRMLSWAAAVTASAVIPNSRYRRW